MGEFSFIDQLLNVCRSVSDVLHILLYVLLVLLAILFAAHKTDDKFSLKYIYKPLVRYCYRTGWLVPYVPYRKGRTTRNTAKRTLVWAIPSRWAPLSNRLFYASIIIRNFFKKF